MRKTGKEEINELLHSQGHPCDRARHEGKSLASQLSNEDFKASNGWLETFVKRNNIKFGKLHGEAGDCCSEQQQNTAIISRDKTPRIA